MSALVIGLMTNNLLPGRLGEIVRAFFLGRKGQLGKSYLLATVVVDRVLDLGVLVVLGLVVLAFTPPLPWIRMMAVSGGAALAAILCVVGFLISPGGTKTITKVGQVLIPACFRQKLTAPWQEFQLGLRSIGPARRALWLVGLSFLIWFAMGLSLFSALQAFHLDLPFWGLILLLVVLNLGGLIPSSPGYVGTYHFLAVLTLEVFGVGKEQALGFALVNHALWYTPITLAGLILLWHENLTLWQLTRKPGP